MVGEVCIHPGSRLAPPHNYNIHPALNLLAQLMAGQNQYLTIFVQDFLFSGNKPARTLAFIKINNKLFCSKGKHEDLITALYTRLWNLLTKQLLPSPYSWMLSVKSLWAKELQPTSASMTNKILTSIKLYF